MTNKQTYSILATGTGKPVIHIQKTDLHNGTFQQTVNQTVDYLKDQGYTSITIVKH